MFLRVLGEAGWGVGWGGVGLVGVRWGGVGVGLSSSKSADSTNLLSGFSSSN